MTVRPEPSLADPLLAAAILSAPVAAVASFWSVPIGAAAFGVSIAGWLLVAGLYRRFPPAGPIPPVPRLPFPRAWPQSAPVLHRVPRDPVSIEKTHDGVVFRRPTSWLQPFAAMELTLSSRGVVARSRLRTVVTPWERLTLHIGAGRLRVRSDDGRVHIEVDHLPEPLLDAIRDYCDRPPDPPVGPDEPEAEGQARVRALLDGAKERANRETAR